MSQYRLPLFPLPATVDNRSTQPVPMKPKRTPSLFDDTDDRPQTFVERFAPQKQEQSFGAKETIRREPLSQPPPETSSGEKAKARDILAAIRTLKHIDARLTPATPEEREILRRFPGFGPVALSIFPNPATGQFKPGWEEIGNELKEMLTPEEYDSAKRTTFNAFYTSPTVIEAMHGALKRLGVPENALVLERTCPVNHVPR